MFVNFNDEIDIYDYLDRLYINYIVYHKERLIRREEVNESNKIFGNRLLENIQDIESLSDQSQIEAIQQMLREQARSPAGSLRILSRLQDGTILSDALDQIAEAINTEIDNATNVVDFSNYDDIVRRAKDFSDLFVSSPEVSRVNEFFNLVLEALNMAKLSSPDILDALSDIGQHLIGTDFAIDQTQASIAQVATSQDIEISKNVLRYLSNAMTKLESIGAIDARSFATTIQYIFTRSSGIGGEIGKLIYANAIQNADIEIQNAINNMIKRSNGKLKGITSQNKKYTNTINVKIFDRDVLQLKMRGSAHTDFTIEIGNLSDIQWYTKKKKKVDLGIKGFKKSESLQNYFTPGEERYHAYNMIAHRYSGPEFEESVNIIKSSVAASFLNEWVHGGMEKSPSPFEQNLQFIIINKKIYPLSRIIKNICNSFADVSYGTNASLIEIQGSVKNKWVGGKFPNIEDALSRSNMINEIMNTFLIAMNLNSNILAQYVY